MGARWLFELFTCLYSPIYRYLLGCTCICVFYKNYVCIFAQLKLFFIDEIGVTVGLALPFPGEWYSPSPWRSGVLIRARQLADKPGQRRHCRTVRRCKGNNWILIVNSDLCLLVRSKNLICFIFYFSRISPSYHGVRGHVKALDGVWGPS